ncbi:uncharacterized protein LOC103574550 [Microplitis demolitor]|uniref:uncharacterized protein LOC103574550 n=1 Tax=Microplitis demolitor TaxID=69319 RepID=UPI0004CD4205|nr:uncharacterized protein LOC103574550 [Microplitis demolitor]
MLSILIFFCLIVVPFSQATNCCSRSNLSVAPVDFTKQSGRWFLYQRSLNNFKDSIDECNQITWGKPVNGVSTVVSTSISKLVNETLKSVAQVSSNQGTSFTYYSPVFGEVPAKYITLETDYNNYSIAIICEKRKSKCIIKAYVFTRERTPSCNIRDITKRSFSKYNLTLPKMHTYDLKNCP